MALSEKSPPEGGSPASRSSAEEPKPGPLPAEKPGERPPLRTPSVPSLFAPELRARAGQLSRQLVGRWQFWMAAMLLLFVLPIARGLTLHVPPGPKDLGAVPAFTLTDQAGRPFGSKELAGKVVIVDFIFTRCGSICPHLSSEMATIQHRLRNAGDAVHLVSITVDPEWDNPARLEAYARVYHANERVWSFLTGPFDRVKAAVVRGFKETMEKDPLPGGDASDYSILHGGHLVLVDQRGHLRGYYDTEKADIDRLMSDVALVMNGPLSGIATSDW